MLQETREIWTTSSFILVSSSQLSSGYLSLPFHNLTVGSRMWEYQVSLENGYNVYLPISSMLGSSQMRREWRADFWECVHCLFADRWHASEWRQLYTHCIESNDKWIATWLLRMSTCRSLACLLPWFAPIPFVFVVYGVFVWDRSREGIKAAASRCNTLQHTALQGAHMVAQTCTRHAHTHRHA